MKESDGNMFDSSSGRDILGGEHLHNKMIWFHKD